MPPELRVEAGQSLGIAGDFVRKKFEGHEAAQACVLSFVDNAHPAPAKFLDDLIVGNGATDHEQMSAFWSVHLMDEKVLSQQNVWDVLCAEALYPRAAGQPRSPDCRDIWSSLERLVLPAPSAMNCIMAPHERGLS
jgi:hypothetical protein